MLNSADFASMKNDVAAVLLDRCTFKGRANNTLASNVPCSITREAATATAVTVELNAGITTYMLVIPAIVYLDAQPTVPMTLVDDLQVVTGGHTYEIDEILDAQTPFIFRQIRVARVSL